MLTLISKYRWVIAAMLIFMAAYMVEWLTFYADMPIHPVRPMTIFKMVADALLFYLPFMVLSRRWQPLVLLQVWLLPLFFCVNVMYCRFFGDIMPINLPDYMGNLSSLTPSTLTMLLRWSDVVYLLMPTAVTLLYFCVLRPQIARSKPLSRKTRAWWAVAIVGLLISTQALLMAAHASYGRTLYQTYTYKDSLRYNYLTYPYGTRIGQLYSKGLAPYLLVATVHQTLYKGENITLTDSQIDEIDRFIAQRPSTDSQILTDNRGKNLIFIIVESFNSWAVDYRIGDFEVMPCLSRLMADEMTIANRHVVTQVSEGGSSDAHIMYNTGLLPLPKDAIALNMPTNAFPSLAHELEGYTAIDINPVVRSVWNKYDLDRSMGYDRFYSLTDITERYPDIDDGGYDRIVMDLAIDLIADLPRPFMVEICTLSSHTPFNEPDATIYPEIEGDTRLSQIERKYLQTIRYFDEQLCRFIDRLKADGIYDDTVIVIAGDHNVLLNTNTMGASDGEVPFVALNTGITRSIDRTVGQIDVYPTIAAIMGIEPRWPGLGMSMLDRQLNSAIDRFGEAHGEASETMLERQRRAWSVSELMVCGNYFANRPTKTQ